MPRDKFGIDIEVGDMIVYATKKEPDLPLPVMHHGVIKKITEKGNLVIVRWESDGRFTKTTCRIHDRIMVYRKAQQLTEQEE
ncbi:MAG: hypothetical protein ACOC44_16510 [Promethearchaeia archaeon]